MQVVKCEMENRGYRPHMVLLLHRGHRIFECWFRDPQDGVERKAFFQLLPGDNLLFLDYGMA